ncbi:SMI1/KNR4 family protein [Luteolibacter sp. GHJ8]|uniref:SMI1/KNR4 family protein n=1 Tax=Luteolibacter rhizosphaerae TaxID=2989719 RepID=A0ABT3G9J7_9BACT|nr:SMI1/KNR4 family protein [Luteolibacter rhizosphaerae]MCW1916527.1 SMI1/KNR4 family protein [Luteolibacter rhizosphaerae]
MRLAEIWTGAPVTEGEITAIRAVAPESIANELERFYRKCNGAERGFNEVDYAADKFDCLRIDAVDITINPETRRTLEECFPGYWVIGSDAGAQLIAYDMDAELPWPIVLILPGDDAPPTVLARNLDELCELYFSPTDAG